jgi:hypothetical protein
MKEFTPAEKVSVPCAHCAVPVVRTATAAARRGKRLTFCSQGCHAAYRKQQQATAIEVRLNDRMRNSIREALSRRGLSKKAGRSWMSIAGYTTDELMAHLARQFTKRMSWQNMGKWHIDHIVPLASFRFDGPDDPNFKAAWALTNLRPLWRPKNLSKGAQRLTLL